MNSKIAVVNIEAFRLLIMSQQGIGKSLLDFYTRDAGTGVHYRGTAPTTL